MGEPGSLTELLTRHQEGLAGATGLSLLFSANYAIIKKLSLIFALTGALTSGLTAGALWLFLAEYLHLVVYFIVPVAFGCAWGAYPLLAAWSRKDDAFMSDAVDGASGWLGRWMRKKLGGGT